MIVMKIETVFFIVGFLLSHSPEQANVIIISIILLYEYCILSILYGYQKIIYFDYITIRKIHSCNNVLVKMNSLEQDI